MDFKAVFLGKTGLVSGVKSYRFKRPDGFAYSAGQYFILKLGEGLVKAFSFSSSPNERDYFEFTTRVSGSEYKKMLDSLRAGDEVSVSAPYGAFTYGGQKRLVFLAGGIGITPCISMLRFMTEEGIDCDAVLVYGNRTREGIVYKDELDRLSKTNSRLKVVHVLADERAPVKGCYRGFICDEVIRKEVPDPLKWSYMVCGPPAMVSAMQKMLEEMGVPGDQVIVEGFSGL